MAVPLAGQNEVPSSKQRLDAETIIAAGLHLAARPGTTAITVRELGTLLDADPTAIYRHFRNKEELMQALLDRLVGLCIEGVTAPPAQWRERLEQFASSTLAVFTEYPAIGVNAIVLSTNGPAELEAVELLLDALHTAGLEGDELVLQYAVLSSYMLSYASGIARTQSGNAPGSTRWWLPGTRPDTAASHPNVSAQRDLLVALRDRDIYSAGITAFLDAVEITAAITASITVETTAATTVETTAARSGPQNPDT